MNKERLLLLADVVQKGHHKFNGIDALFNMSEWMQPLNLKDMHVVDRDFLIPNRSDLKDDSVNKCNTAACMAGFACLMFDYQDASHSLENGNYNVRKTAQALLGITDVEASDLFTLRTDRSITGPDAAKVIRNFVKTGNVDWYIIYIS